MVNDYLMVAGIIIGVLSIPSLLNAFSSDRPLTRPLAILVIAAGLVLTAVYRQPTGYSIDSVPEVFARVIASFTR